MRQQNYSYPLDPDWTTDEMETVIAFLRTVEDAYEIGAPRGKILEKYRAFKKVVRSKAGEKQLGRQFAKSSGYQLYTVVKLASTSQKKMIKVAND
ncbi:UPF0223 family protein [Limosilactobacillus panis]|uniref:UPF0223 family protein n=1 Tax=Limosilactobacillus panis TaxID=47493 RepID=UPI001C97389F|nr:UPF0223 family protein [Limosilactobacillus panis]QZN93740.1 UPF0223 family protein [Limosilactobacillus panis]